MGLGPFLPHGTGPGYTTSNDPVPTQPPYVPTFRTDVTVQVPGAGNFRLNSTQFATAETADYLAKRYGAIGTFEKEVGFGPYVISAPQETLIFTGGVAYNAGDLAEAFILWPEDKDPGVADRWIRQAIANLQAKASA